jgi:hypothetical protein
VPGAIDVECAGLFASKPAPTGVSGVAGLCRWFDLIEHAVSGDFGKHDAVGNAQQGIAITG